MMAFSNHLEVNLWRSKNNIALQGEKNQDYVTIAHAIDSINYCLDNIMKRLRSFITITLLGGLTVVLPIAIFVLLAEWILDKLRSMIQPLSHWLVQQATVTNIVADFTVVILIMTACFLIGLLVKTSLGRWTHEWVDEWLGKVAPGYGTINELVSQIFGGQGNKSLLKGEVCRAYIMGRHVPVSVTGIITARHENGDVTVYVATAPIPTSGMIYHLAKDCVDLLPNVSVEAAMKTVIACGSGSQSILQP
jgi:uncharacterized membrane protein